MATMSDLWLPLESGDRLSREEFHRRYCARPDIKKAELIEGVVYVPSPLRYQQHGRPHSTVMFWLGLYTVSHPELGVADNATLLIGVSEVQPDAMLFREEGQGGHVRVTPDDYLTGVPDLIVEIAASSAAYDLHDKKALYERAGVPEYVVWQVLEERISWFRLTDGGYSEVLPDRRGIITSSTFPDLRLSIPAMLAGDNAAVVTAMRRARRRGGRARPD